jgi:ApaG protein
MAMQRIRRRGSKDAPVYEATTNDILVRVVANYMPDQSDPEAGRWFWGYVVEIENHGVETVQLISRHWIITDSQNRVQEVRGEGVVGEQPVLKPREAFRYTSGCPLPTTSGSMRGAYQMVTDDGDPFDVMIPEFSLDLPGARRVVN